MAIEPRTWHRADRPSWDCVICNLPWPCAPAKVELAEEFLEDSTSGTIYLTMSMHCAIGDSFYRAGPEPAELWNRFLGWYVALRLKRPTGDRPHAGLGTHGPADGIDGGLPSTETPSQTANCPKDSL